jgi:intracellular sulfur oxidation DsrE/DsrF family protein
MSHVLLTSQQPDEALGLATTWVQGGAEVTVVLLDGATAVLRAGHRTAARVDAARAAGVTVLAHADAVAERTIRDAPVDLIDLDAVADLVAEPGSRVQWW